MSTPDRQRWLSIAILGSLLILRAAASDPGHADSISVSRQSQDDLGRIQAACSTFEPYFAVAIQQHTEDGDYGRGKPAILAFNGQPGQTMVLAEQREVGTVFGLAHDIARSRLYAAAYHKRSTAFGPSGPGAIYRIDLIDGSTRELSRLPAGADRHDFQRNLDQDAAPHVGLTGLGDIDISDNGDELYAVNLTLNRIERLSLPDGASLGSFRHGGAGREWQRNARLLGIGVREGWLYHAVVDSREFLTTPGTLSGYIFRSRGDGSEMSELGRFEFDYPRSLGWNRWDSSFFIPTMTLGPAIQINAQPMIADIDFTRGGDILVGLRDRWVDMLPGLLRSNLPRPGVGDLLPARDAGGLWPVITSPEFYTDGVVSMDEAIFGSLAPFPGFDMGVGNIRAPGQRTDLGAQWHWHATGDRFQLESLADIAVAAEPDRASGLGDVEPLCAPWDDPHPAVVPTATAAVLTATANAGLTQTAIALTPTAIPQGTPENFDERIRESCASDNPWSATVCYPPAGLDQFNFDGPTVIGFRDTPGNNPQYGLLNASQVGSVWGLGYASQDGQLYTSAFHKRLSFYGPDGPGAIYRSDIGTGLLETFAIVPNAGRDPHSNIAGGDSGGRDWAGKISLGDLDLNWEESELYVVNAFDRQIYRYQAASAQLLGAFAHGASAEPWARDARPFGLEERDGRLYHGIVNSAEASGRREDLAALVYSSLPDGTDMRLEVTLPLTYTRGTVDIPGVIQVGGGVTLPLDWLPWRSGYNDLSAGRAQMTLYPQPMLSDIAFAADGDMLVAIHDRHTDMSLAYQIQNGNDIRKPGVGLGDVIHVPWDGSGWDSSAADPDYFDQPPDSIADRHLVGGLDMVRAFDNLVANRLSLSRPNPMTTLLIPTEGAIWYDDAGNQLRLERICFERLFPSNPFLRPLNDAPAAPDHSEWLPGKGMGDLEVLCGPTPTPTPTEPSTPSPSPTSTGSVTPSPSETPSPSPSPTRELKPIYLPITISDSCDPKQQRVDVVLVIDASTTMLFETRAGRTKIEAAIEAAGRFLDRMTLPGDQAALVIFNADATVLSELSGDRAALDVALAGIQNREFTRIHLGLDAARALLTGDGRVAEHRPAIVMLTDGRSNPDPVARAIEAAERVKQDGIRLFTIGLGEDVEFEALRRMATRPEDFRWAPDGEDLGPLYEQIAVEIPCPPESYWPYLP